MNRGKLITPELEAEICAEIRSGMWLSEIAAKHHISKRRVMAIRDRNGIPNRLGGHGTKSRQKMTPEREAAIVADLKSGLVLYEILQKYHIGYDKLADIQDRHDLFRQKGKRIAQEEAEFWDKFPQLWDEARFRIIGHKREKPRESWIKV